ncbi:GerMN domain-containing protein [Chloroflexia bacterium SDU3-3]|nr:GerMN domain-containing protein [Chloroflexia bacterium SDU3-3]
MEPSGHCPYLGLKQNRAIRFASPTTEHRCYVSGEPIDIPVNQASFCLAAGHVHCPLYTGSMLPTTQDVPAPPAEPPAQAEGGMRSWLATLAPRDRAIYTLMLVMLGLIGVISLTLGLRAIWGKGQASAAPTASPQLATLVPTDSTAHASVTVLPATPTVLPTTLPTSTPTLAATAQPTMGNVMFPPTQPAEPAPTQATSAAPSAAPSSTSAPSATPTAAPSATLPSRTPQSTPTATMAAASQQQLTLYFGDASGTLYIPVQRTVAVAQGREAEAAVRELIAGSRTGLVALVGPEVHLISAGVAGGTATINLDQRLGERAQQALVLTLTQLAGVQRVQLQVNGASSGQPASRPVLNPLNPDGLAEDTSMSEFLPLYFPLADGSHDVRVMRVVPKTKDTASATVQALLDGPGSYGPTLQRVIPQGTALRQLALDRATRVITVDLSEAFSRADSREAAVRNLVQSLTTLPDVRGVQILVEGKSLGDYWGEAYRSGFGRPQINPE